MVNTEYGPGMEQFLGERLEPAEQRGLLPAPAHCWHCQLDQVRRSTEILGCKRVPDRIGRRTIMLEPLACPTMQSKYLIWLLRHQVCLENVGKEVMVAEPNACIVQRNDEQVAPLQGAQQCATFLLVGDGVAQRATQPVEDRCLKQEAPDACGLALQDLLDQVVQNVAVISGESFDERWNVLSPAHRGRR